MVSPRGGAALSRRDDIELNSARASRRSPSATDRSIAGEMACSSPVCPSYMDAFIRPSRVVTVDGCASQIRVIRSLDAGGLDEEAVMAAAQWRFEPGRLGTTPVPVIVTIVVDFSVR